MNDDENDISEVPSGDAEKLLAALFSNTSAINPAILSPQQIQQLAQQQQQLMIQQHLSRMQQQGGRPVASSTASPMYYKNQSPAAQAAATASANRKRALEVSPQSPTRSLRSSQTPSRSIKERRSIAVNDVVIPTQSKSQSASTKDTQDIPMEPEALQDVISYAGVNMKEEAEMILRESDMMTQPSSANSTGVDKQSSWSHIVNAPVFKSRVQSILKQNRLKSGSDECMDLIAIALQERIVHVLEELTNISKHRVDHRRDTYKWKPLNDPKKQIWLLDKFETDINKAFRSEESVGSIMQQDKGKKVKKKKNEKEELAMKTKLANSAALAALGMPKKSWMVSGPEPTSSSLPSKSSSKVSANQAVTAQKHHQAVLSRRTITIKDILYFMEHEPSFRKSNFLYEKWLDLK